MEGQATRYCTHTHTPHPSATQTKTTDPSPPIILPRPATSTPQLARSKVSGGWDPIFIAGHSLCQSWSCVPASTSTSTLK